MKNPELQIINRLKSGDKKVFEDLFFDYYPTLTVFAKKYVGDMDTSREIVQDLFVRLYETREKINIHSSLKNYLYSAVRNRCLNHLKREKLHTEHTGNVLSIDESLENDIQAKIEQTEFEYLVWQEVSNLPDQCKRIFYLSRKEGKKNKEIAEQLGISIRTVETQISKALKRLRTNLRQYLSVLFIF